MPVGNAHHDSPAPTRILRPRQDTRPRQNTQLSKGRSNTGTSSHTMLSPVESTDYNQRDNHTPDETYRGSSPMSSPTVDIEPGNEASHVAVRGSVPPSPILKARRLKVKDNAYSPAQVPSPGGWSASDDKARTEDDALAKSESIVEVAEGIVIEDQGLPSIPVPRTANNGRVIAIDLDLVLPRLSPSANRQESTHGATGGNEPIQRAHVQVIDEPQMVISPTDMKGAVSGLLFALKHLRSLGHPLHLVASRAPSERSEIEFWLAGQGISLGTDDDDVVAALWLAASAEDTLGSTAAAGAGTGRGRGVFSRGTRDPPPKRGVSKLKVLRAMNAALFVTAPTSLDPALITAAPDLPVIVLDHKTPSVPLKTGDGLDGLKIGLFDPVQDAKATAGPAGLGAIVHQGRWGEVVAWVKAWDSK